MRKFHVICAAMACFLFASFACAVPLTQENGVFPASAEIHKRVCDNIRAEPYYNDLELEIGISSAAVSSDGEVAIISKSSKGGCDFIISEYLPDGTFKRGYKIDYDVLKGRTQLFYSDEGDLCYLCSYRAEVAGKVKYPDVVVVFGDAGIQESYEVPDIDGFFIENMSDAGSAEIYVSPTSRYCIEKLDKAYLSIADTDTGEVYEIYNQTEAYDEYFGVVRRNKNIYFAICACMLLLFAVYMLRRSKGR